jgi:hypothetical protein
VLLKSAHARTHTHTSHTATHTTTHTTCEHVRAAGRHAACTTTTPYRISQSCTGPSPRHGSLAGRTAAVGSSSSRRCSWRASSLCARRRRRVSRRPDAHVRHLQRTARASDSDSDHGRTRRGHSLRAQ